MDNRLLRLRSEDVRGAHSYAVWRTRALLESMPLGDQRLELVYENARVFCDSSVGLCRCRNGSHELFGEHGRAYLKMSLSQVESCKL
jgi:hypothetical protein